MNSLLNQIARRKKRPFLLIIATLLLLLAAVTPAYAATFRDGETIEIAAGERVEDDLFISAQTINIDGVIAGNLFAAGSEVNINGTVEGSVFAAGQTLIVNGTIDGSLFASGYSLDLGPEARTDGNLFFSGFSLITAANSEVGHGIYGSGYQFVLKGIVEEDVNVGAGALELTGIVGGDVAGQVGEAEGDGTRIWMPNLNEAVPIVPAGMRVAESAEVAGNIDVELTPSAESGVEAPMFSLNNDRTRWVVGETVALLFVGLLLLWLRPGWLRRTGVIAKERWLSSIGVGVLALAIAALLVPLAAGLIILFALIGDWISLGQLAAPILGIGLTGLVFILAVFLFLVGMVSKIIVAALSGRFLLRRFNRESIPGHDLWALVAGILIYMMLRAIPFGVGFLFGLFVTLLGLGAYFLTMRTNVVKAV